jgi:uncharacterized LabA/DUF88 family protein
MNGTTRTFLQIDLQNLFFEARKKDEKIDFEKILEIFNSRETEYLTEPIVYLIRSQDFDSEKFETKLSSWGYKIQAKNAYRFIKDGRPYYKQTNLDVEIAVDCLKKIDTFDKWILMSGDGDFAYLCKHVQQLGKKVEIWSFKECYNQILEPDKINFITEELFYKKPQVKVFGFKWGPEI